MNHHMKVLHEIEEAQLFDAGPSVRETGATKNAQGNFHVANDESLRLVHQVFLTKTEQPPKVVVFAAMDHGNGCSHISASVAETLAADDERSVCLVNADFRSKAAPGSLPPTHGYGLTEALNCKIPIHSLFRPADVHGNLWSLSRGTLTPRSPGLFTSGSLQERIEELRAGFDFVIIDTAPLRRYADAFALAQLADGLVLVVEAGTTRRDETAEAVASLRASRINILAAVLNKDIAAVPEKIYRHL
jgi:polysaccharide biosynthesis transport protein